MTTAVFQGVFVADPITIALLSSLAAGVGSVISAWQGRRQSSSEPQAQTIDDRINDLRSNLAASSDLIGEINAEFELQVAAAERIKAEAEENQKLAALNEEEAEAVRKVVERTIEGAQTRASKVGGRQQWLFFLAGLLAAIPLGVAGNFAFELVKAWMAS